MIQRYNFLIKSGPVQNIDIPLNAFVIKIVLGLTNNLTSISFSNNTPLGLDSTNVRKREEGSKGPTIKI